MIEGVDMLFHGINSERRIRFRGGMLLLAPLLIWVLHCAEAKNIEDTLVQGNEFIVSTIPSNGFGAHSRDRAIVVAFTRDMDPATVTAPGVIQVTDSTAAVVAGTVTYHNIGKAAVFMPAGLLASGELYTVTVAGTVTDTQANTMGAPYTFTFTTFVQNSPKLAEDTTVPSIVFRYPVNGSASVTTTTGISISFDEPLHPGSLTPGIVRLTDGVNTVPTVVTYIVPGNTIMMFPEVLLRNNTTYTIEVAGGITDTSIVAPNTMQAAAPATTVSTWSFTTELDQIPPEVYSTSPINGSNGVALDASISVTFSEEIDQLTLDPVNFEVLDLTAGGVVPGAYQFDVISNTATFVPTAGTFSPSSTIQVTLNTMVADLSGNGLTAPVQFTFTSGTQLDTVPPTVVSTSPVNGSVNTNLNVNITTNFSEPMLPATVGNNSIQLTLVATTNPLVPVAEIGATVAGNVFYNGTNNSAVFMPASDLYPNTDYQLNIATTVADLSGKNMAAAFSSAFQTGAQSDLTGPVVVQTTPTNGAASVASGTAITATFDEELNASTVTAANVTLSDGTANISGSVSHLFDGVNSMVTFTPDPATPLIYGKVYTVTLNTQIKDVAGNPMTADYRWSFFMEPPLPPSVAYVTPANGATTVANGDPITIHFNRLMDATTINTSTVSIDDGMTIVPAVVSYADDPSDPVYIMGVITIIPDPAMPLQPGLIYTVSVSGTVTDIDGVALGAEYRWSFSVRTLPGPQVASVTPLNGETNFSTAGIISATVNGQVDMATLNDTTFTLTDGATVYRGNVSGLYDTATNKTTLVYTPDATFTPLTEGVLYLATLTTGIADISGNNMLSDYSWSFYIPSQATNPMVIAVTPAPDSSNVLVNSPISVTFAAPLDANTIANLQNLITVEYSPLGSPEYLLKVLQRNISKGIYSLAQPVKANVFYDSLTDTLLIDIGGMADYTLYTVKVKAGITDIYGTTSAVDSSWSFTTELNYSILVTVNGLASPNSLVVKNNTDGSTVRMYAGIFSQYMPNKYNMNTPFDVVIDTAASSLSGPVQSCGISSTRDMRLTSSYVLVQINCYTQPFNIGGTITGIIGGWARLLLNGGVSSVTLSADGPFQFPTPLPDRSIYNVTLLDQAPGYSCQVINANSFIAGADVTNVMVDCVPVQPVYVFTDITGLPPGDQVLIQIGQDLIGQEFIAAYADGLYQFQTPFLPGDTYYVTVSQQPVSATCTSSMPGPEIVDPNIQPVAFITCVANHVPAWTSVQEGVGDAAYVDAVELNGFIYALGSMVTSTGQQCMVVHRLVNVSYGITRDPTWDPAGDGARRFLFCPPGGESIRPVGIKPDALMDLIIVGNAAGGYPYMIKMTQQGQHDTVFANGGFFISPALMGLNVSNMIIQEDRNILLVGQTGPMDPVLVRTTPEGALDASFGVGGAIHLLGQLGWTVDPTLYLDFQPVEVVEDVYTGMGYFITINALNMSTGMPDLILHSFNANGSPNPSFGQNGSVMLPNTRSSGIFLNRFAGIIVHGATQLSGDPAGTLMNGFLAGYNFTGAPTSISGGSGGMVTYAGCTITDLMYSSDAHYFAAAMCNGTSPSIMKINGADGTLIPTYGVNGQYTHVPSGGVSVETRPILYADTRDIVILGYVRVTTMPSQMFVWRVPSF